MKEVLHFWKYLSILLPLTQEFRYELLFMVSNYLYHSIDYFFKAHIQDEKDMFILNLLDSFSLRTFGIIITLMSFGINGIVFFEIFIMKKEHFLIQIQERLLFPLQIYYLIRIISNGYHSQPSMGIQELRAINLIFCVSVTFSLMLLFVKNFALNLRYSDNSQKTFNRLFKLEFLILVGKLFAALICALFIQQPYAYIVLIFILNLIQNASFRVKIFYENPHLEYITLLSQFFIWIPWACGLMQMYNFNSTNIEIIKTVCFLFYVVLGLKKSKILMDLLQRKYLSKFQCIRLKKNFKKISDSSQKNINSEIQIGFLSVLKPFLFEQENLSLQWSQHFRSEVLAIFQQVLESIDKEYQLDIKNQSYTSKSTSNHSVTAPFKQSNLQQNIRDYSNCRAIAAKKLWRLINKFLKESNKSSPQLYFFICYNYPDYTNVMKQRIFYSFFLQQKKLNTVFNNIDRQICYSFLVDKIGRQRVKENYFESQFSLNQNSINQENSCMTKKKLTAEFLINEVNTEDDINCVQTFGNFYHPKYNEIIKENTLFNTILKELNQFVQNQEKYIDLNTKDNNQKLKIIKYFRKRKQLRQKIEEDIQQYCNLNIKLSRFYMGALFKYLKDFWLNNDKIIAYQNFKYRLQTIVKQRRLITKFRFFHKQPDCNDEVQKTMTCVISGISQFGNIVMSSSEFKRFSEMESILNSGLEFQNSQQYELNNKNRLDNLILPLWRQKHQQLLRSNDFYESPSNHLQKRYFLMSLKKTKLLQVKFKMLFHMMHEKDLLIVLDMAYEKLNNLVVLDDHKKAILFHHKALKSNKNQCKRLSNVNRFNFKIEQSSSDYEKSESLMDEIQQIYSNVKFEKVKLFGINYQIYTENQRQQQSTKKYGQCENSIRIKSFVQLQDDILSKQKSQQEQIIKQHQFYHYKNNFSQYRLFTLFVSIFYLASVLIIIVFLQVLVIQQKNGLFYLIHAVENKIELGENYATQNFDRTIDLGMLTNIYTRQIDLRLMKPEDTQVMFTHILDSMKKSILVMKEKHKVHPFSAENSIENKYYLQPDWIQGHSQSLQMRTYFNQMAYIQCSKIFVSINQLEVREQKDQHHGSSSQIELQLNLPKRSVSSLQFYRSMSYLKMVLADQYYYFNGTESVFGQFKQAEQQVFDEVHGDTLTVFILFGSIIGLISVIELLLAYIIIKKIVDLYKISLNVSDVFLHDFRKSNLSCRQFLSELHSFSKERIFNLVVPCKTQSKAIHEGHQQTHSSQKVLQLSKSNQNLRAHNYRKLGKKSDKQLQHTYTFVWFIIRMMKFPLVRALVLFTSLSVFYSNQSRRFSDLQNFSTGISELTGINLSLLNLLSTNLFLTNLKTFQYSEQEQAAAMRSLSKEFNDVNLEISTIDKIKIIKKLFLQQSQNQKTINKILYRNICRQFEQEMNCPDYMREKMTGLSQKYGQTMKKVHLLFRNLISAPMTIYGTFNTSKFQSQFIQSYENMNQLLFVNQKLKLIAFQNLQQSVGLKSHGKEQSHVQEHYQVENPEIFILAAIMLIEGVWFVIKFKKESTIVNTEFLRIGSWEMMERENNFQKPGYQKYFHQSQYSKAPSLIFN